MLGRISQLDTYLRGLLHPEWSIFILIPQLGRLVASRMAPAIGTFRYWCDPLANTRFDQRARKRTSSSIPPSQTAPSGASAAVTNREAESALGSSAAVQSDDVRLKHHTGSSSSSQGKVLGHRCRGTIQPSQSERRLKDACVI
jgi:hypothetical protein